MRNMSFSLTTQQILDRSKTVTRRTGWKFLKPGDRIRAVKKAMGLRKGEKVEQLAVLEITSVGHEPLKSMLPTGGKFAYLGARRLQDRAIALAECRREGFPALTPEEFVRMFIASHKGCTRSTVVTRIEFKYVDDPAVSR